MTNDHGAQQITDYLARFFPDVSLGDEEDIFELGLVNSLFALQLVHFVEHAFDIVIENEDLELDNFRSIGAMSRFVERKLAAGSPVERRE